MLFGTAVEAVLPGAVHLLALLAVVTVAAWRRPRWSRGLRVVLAGALAWTWLLSTPALANLLVAHLEGPVPSVDAVPPRDDATLVVVLASGEVSHRGGARVARLDDAGTARVAAAVAWWRHTGGRLVMAGGAPTAGPGTSVAGEMARLAVAWGVPSRAVAVVEGSSRTQGDLAAVAGRVRGHGGPVWLVTSALHMPRALAAAAALGLPVQAHRCDYRQFTQLRWDAWLPNAGAPAAFAPALHEWLGLAYYRWRQWA